MIGGNVDDAVSTKHIPIAAGSHLAGPDGVAIDPDRHYFVVLRVDCPVNP